MPEAKQTVEETPTIGQRAFAWAKSKFGIGAAKSTQKKPPAQVLSTTTAFYKAQTKGLKNFKSTAGKKPSRFDTAAEQSAKVLADKAAQTEALKGE